MRSRAEMGRVNAGRADVGRGDNEVLAVVGWTVLWLVGGLALTGRTFGTSG